MYSIEYQQELLQNLLFSARESLKNKPDGLLTICRNHNTEQYFLRDSAHVKKGIYISKKDQDLIHALAQKDYDLKFIKAAEKLAIKLDWLARMNVTMDIHFLYQELGQVYENLSDPRKNLVSAYVLPDHLFALKWQSKEYQGGTFSKDDPWFLTDKNERVRSKSEVIIANMLNKYGIPYRYEFPIYTKSLGTLYPDFFLLDLWNRREIIFEHFGLLHEVPYRKRTKEKIEAYSQKGYALGKGFIFTFEDADNPLNMNYVSDLLASHFPHVVF